eukprot:2553413-Pyramimonas_sp.AAC.1
MRKGTTRCIWLPIVHFLSCLAHPCARSPLRAATATSALNPLPRQAFEAYSEKSKELKLAVDAELKGTVDDALHWVQNVTFAYMVVKGKLDNEGSTNPAVDTREAMVQLQARMSEAGFVPGRRLPSV